MTVPIQPIRKQLVVEASIERAFAVFTANMTTWWPRTFAVGASPFVACVVEPRVGGRWYERAADGVECEWGKVLVWEPPGRLVLAWQLDARFQYDPALITEVEVRFTALGASATRVELEHRHLERFGAAAANLIPMMEPGWGSIVESFAGAARTAP